MLKTDQITAVVLAGGFGTRIRHLLHDVPKPMAPVAGRPFLEWVVRYLAGQGIRRVVLSTGHLAEVVERHFAAQPVSGVHVTCVPEKQPLGTAGGFFHAAECSGEQPGAWLVLNGDSLAVAGLAGPLKVLNQSDTDGVISGVPMTDAARYGTLAADADGRLTGFREKQPGAGVVNAGIYLFKHELLKRFPAERPLSFESGVFPHWLQTGVRLRIWAASAPFLDIGTPESLAQAEAFVARHLAETCGN